MTNTLLTLRESVLAYLQVADTGTPVNKTDLVRGSTDLILLAANNALRAGQKRHDFNLLYGTVDVTVSPTLGTKWSYSDEGTFSETMEYYLIGDTMITDGLPSTLPAGVESGDLLSATITGTGAGIYLYLGHIETPPKVVFCGTYTGVFANPDAEVVYTYRTQGMLTTESTQAVAIAKLQVILCSSNLLQLLTPQ